MEIKLPSLGEGVDSGTIAAILVSEGDKVQKEQSLLELESDKAVAEMPSPQAGEITEIRVSEGDEVSVGDVLMILEPSDEGDEDADDAEDSDDEGADDSAEADDDESGEESEEAEEPDRAEEPGDGDANEGKSKRRSSDAQKDGTPPVPAAPSVRRVARQVGIDLNRVSGSGRGGRVQIEDLRAYVKGLEHLAERARQPVDPTAGLSKLPDFAEHGEVERIGATAVRKAIARHVAASWPGVPQVTQFAEIDVTNLEAARRSAGEAFEEQDLKLTLTVILLKALVPVLQEFRRFNATYDHEQDELVLKKYIHFGIAVDTEQGLLVPVLRDAHQKNLNEISEELLRLAQRAQEHKLTAREMQGGSFSLSNQGSIGGGFFTPLVRYPESAILGVGRAATRPVWNNDDWEPRQILPIALSYDHRIIDGADAARFVEALRHELSEVDEDWIATHAKSGNGPSTGENDEET